MKFRMTPQKLTIGVFACVLLAIPIATAILPKQTRSENENRPLAQFPKLIDKVKWERAENIGDYFSAVNWKSITERENESYMDKVETYFSDHLAGREKWVIASNTMQKMSGKQEINGVYTLDDRMILTFSGYDKDCVQTSLDAMNALAQRHSDVPMYFMLAPTAQEMYSSSLPTYAGYISEKNFIDECYKGVDGITTIDCLSYLSGHANEYTYYRTDHHWTSLGAFYAYTAAAKSLGYSAYGIGSFNIETASSDFRGTLFSKTLDFSVTPDSIDYYMLTSGEPKVRMTVNTGKELQYYDSLYVRDFLSQKDKYASFTGSNQPIVTIETDIDNGKSLLLIKDSYAHSLVPFLSKHYSKITMVDMRYIRVGLDYYLDIDDYSQVLFAFNAISFAEDDSLALLGLTP